ncbi:carbohydrate ABC transporter substrate-binding protein (CUT1 family) [Sediminihabitans luteus]|uniref:Carbohydrate ABC transporter substrate-binding protein (CUT1 family) n=1 Tax=Sediminihabitans luteus TaxID=1138585 RepID=A0A2M9D122_9CELL|nr:maltose ABC transporter substrate-binding protein [Sediminihabitans luteus]PJJ77906.1 carbohydrate ABC transporter substrate-binding protein (CUT1 family) [Sediminihabitans luteus]GII99737.1 sugar ABC transporter substrate-binding protein [Sediminihabitans luteus]
MKVTRRTTAAAVVALTAITALTACSSSDDAASSGSSESAAAPASDQTLTIWLDEQRAPAVEPIAEQFQADTGITVKSVVKDFSTVDQDFISQVPTGKGPDIIVSPHDKLGAYVQNGVVSPIELGDTADQLADVAVQAVTYDGDVYGLPYSIENVALLRNTALVPDVATDFDDVIAKGQAAVEADAKVKYPFLLGLDPKQGDPYHMYPLQTSFGSSVFAQNEDGSYDATRLTLGDEAGQKFAAAVKTWGEEGVLNANITGDIALEAFEKGESPYYLTGPWNVPAIKDAGIDYAIDPLPSAGGEPAQPFLGVNAFFISSKSENKVAATKFLTDYLATDAAQKALFDVGGRPPALTTAYDEVAAADADVKAFGDIGLDGVPMPAIPEMAAVWADWGGAELQLIKGEGDPAEVWTKAADNVESKIK